MWSDVEPRLYRYQIQPWALVQATMLALVARMPGIEQMAGRCASLLKTTNASSLSHAFRRATFAAFVKRMVGLLECQHTPGRGELVALDGMAVTLPKTQRHHCKKYNHTTVGGGVVWTYMIHAARGICPVKVLRVVQGAWHDSVILRQVPLIARGPIYLADPGFYCLDLLQQWLTQGVHFVVRCKQSNFQREILETVGNARWHGRVYILEDVIAHLGTPKRKTRPRVRLVIALLPSGERILLASDQFRWTAEVLLDAYKQRWHIERFHRFLKDTLGLAHLYSFHQIGIEFLIHTALLMALLLFFSDKNPSGDTIVLLRQALRAVRHALGLDTPWKRNTYSPRRSKKSSTRKGKNL